MHDNASPPAVIVQQTHRRLQLLVREVAVLCRRSLADDVFYPAFLDRIAESLDASVASIWIANARGGAECRWQSKPRSTTADSKISDAQRRRKALRVLNSCRGAAFRTGVYVPLRRGTRTIGVVEVLKAPTSDVAAVRRWLRFVQHVAMLATERPSPPAPAARSGESTAARVQLLEFTQAIHQSLDLDETSYTIVNELQCMFGCDRVSLVVVNQRRAHAQAISGQATFNRRAGAVRQLEQQAAHCAAKNEPQWEDRTAAEGTHKLGLIPIAISSTNSAAAVLVVECFAASAAHDKIAERLNVVLPHVSSALQNAWQHASVPWTRPWASCRRWFGREQPWKRRLAIVSAFAAIILFLAIFPVRFHVHGRGKLQPSVQRDVFADLAGIVRQVHVKHGDVVQAGQILATLHNSDLEIALAKLGGEQNAVREQLAAVQRQRHDARTPRGDRERLAGEMLQLQEQLAGFDEQLSLLHAKRERLLIRSPIAGQVVTWNVDRQLGERPVTVGQVLMTIADPDSPWECELFVSECDVGHVADVFGQQSNSSVTYVSVTEPTREHRGTLRDIDTRAELHEEHDHSVRLLVDINRADIAGAAVGTSATARIECGHRPIGYVWLHRLIGFLYTKVWFRVS